MEHMEVVNPYSLALIVIICRDKESTKEDSRLTKKQLLSAGPYVSVRKRGRGCRRFSGCLSAGIRSQKLAKPSGDWWHKTI